MKGADVTYESLLEAMGYTVEDHKYFGSYQGDVYAIVVKDGVRSVARTSYGSCSGCDFLQNVIESDWDKEVDQDTLTAWGTTEWEILSFEAAINFASRYSWDGDGMSAATWLEGHQ